MEDEDGVPADIFGAALSPDTQDGKDGGDL